MENEPIGFKGTPLEWQKFTEKTAYVINNELCEGVCVILRDGKISELEANRDLICASKKMAVALQNLLKMYQDGKIAFMKDSEDSHVFDEMQLNFRKVELVLKEAGLNP